MDENMNLDNISPEEAVNPDLGGQVQCPACGSTDIKPSIKTGMLVCSFCREEFPAVSNNVDTEDDIFALEGMNVYEGAGDIDKNAASLVTLRCESCGAEVVINVDETTQARCHWCRETLSINSKLENGAVPDMILPFSVPKDEAEKMLGEYIDKHKFFAHPVFKREFSKENITGVFMPYMVVDANTHAEFEGKAEHELRSYTVKVGDDDEETRYDAELWEVSRKLDVGIDDLIVESSADKLDTASKKTNNIINSILPFDTENCVEFDSNYLRGCNSEKRDLDISQLQTMVHNQIKDVARNKTNDSMEYYDRGARWESESIEIKGEKWKSAYLPVWLYSYYQKGKDLLHYVAINARTKEICGSIPINYFRLGAISAIIEVLALIVWIFTWWGQRDDDGLGYPIILVAGFVFFFVQYFRYRNSGARHHHESETRAYIRNLVKTDEKIKVEKGLKNSQIKGRNDTKIEGSFFNNDISSKVQKVAKKIAESDG